MTVDKLRFAGLPFASRPVAGDDTTGGSTVGTPPLLRLPSLEGPPPPPLPGEDPDTVRHSLYETRPWAAAKSSRGSATSSVLLRRRTMAAARSSTPGGRPRRGGGCKVVAARSRPGLQARRRVGKRRRPHVGRGARQGGRASRINAEGHSRLVSRRRRPGRRPDGRRGAAAHTTARATRRPCCRPHADRVVGAAPLVGTVVTTETTASRRTPNQDQGGERPGRARDTRASGGYVGGLKKIRARRRRTRALAPRCCARAASWRRWPQPRFGALDGPRSPSAAPLAAPIRAARVSACARRRRAATGWRRHAAGAPRRRGGTHPTPPPLPPPALHQTHGPTTPFGGAGGGGGGGGCTDQQCTPADARRSATHGARRAANRSGHAPLTRRPEGARAAMGFFFFQCCGVA